MKLANHSNFTTHRLKLSATYLAIIMTLSILFSIVIYHVSANQLSQPFRTDTMMGGRRFRPAIVDEEITSLLNQRIAESKKILINRLVLLNSSMLILGIIISYYLASKALAPIEANQEAQNQFISDASHELRTPLTVLKSSNEVALRDKNLTQKDYQQILESNIEETEKLQSLSSSLLELLKDPKQLLSLRTYKLTDIVNESINNIIKLASTKNISIADNITNQAVRTNKEALVRIITILLENAVKYSPPNTKVTVNCHYTSQSTIISVTDQGQGIDKEDIPYIFDRFYRADKSRRRIEQNGYGLGLAIASKLATQIGAKLTIKSEIGVGSTFFVKI